MSKRTLPKVPTTSDPARRVFDEAVKENLELITGQRGSKVEPLRADASLADVIRKLNEVIAAMQ